jgi:hypothetical protein
MAIVGNLSELPFEEIVTVIGNRCGKLTLRKLPNKRQYTLHLWSGSLQALLVDGRPAADAVEAQDHFAELIECQDGDFRFEKTHPEELAACFSLPVQHLLLNGAATADEIRAYRDSLPHPETRFRLAKWTEIRIDGDLCHFLTRAGRLLTHGTSACDVAAHFNFNLEQVRFRFYKLRTLGVIEPVRAFRETPVEKHPIVQTRGLFSRLLGALHVKFGRQHA